MPDTDKLTNQVAEARKISGANGVSRPAALDAWYGRIGISAVAAAARYQGDTKNPPYAPTPTNWRDQYAEEAV
jgi:hypothetical protein